MSEATVGYDPNTPVTMHPGFTAHMYEPFLRNATEVLNVAAGNTDLQADLLERGIPTDVTSLDPVYERPEYRDRPDRIPGYAQTMPFEDGSFDTVICQFGLQHMPEPDAALREMIRVAKPYEAAGNPSAGIFINPVFKPRRMQKIIDELGLTEAGVATLIEHDPGHFPVAERKDVYDTLYICKGSNLTPEVTDQLIARITESGALKHTIRSLGEVIARRRGGRSSR